MALKYNYSDWLQDQDPDLIKQISKIKTKNYQIATFNVRGDLNLGSIIRTSLYFNCQKVNYFRDKRFDRRYCVGSQNYIQLNFIDKNFNSWIKQENIYPIFIEQGGTQLKPGIFKELIHKKNSSSEHQSKIICLIFGNETNGIPNNILKLNSTYPRISIPNFNIVPRSLSVSNTVPIILYQLHNDLSSIL